MGIYIVQRCLDVSTLIEMLDSEAGFNKVHSCPYVARERGGDLSNFNDFVLGNQPPPHHSERDGNSTDAFLAA